MGKRLIATITYAVIISWAIVPSGVLAESTAVDSSIEGKDEGLTVSDIAQELDLTAEQKQQLKEQRYQEGHKRTETRNKIRLKELELRHELEKEEIDREGVNTIVEELKELGGLMLNQRVDSILKMKQILTPEQFERLQLLGERRRQNALKEMKRKFHRSNE